MTKAQSGARSAPPEAVPEGGKAPSPKEPNGQIKPAASASADLDGGSQGTSHATTAKAEKDHAEGVSKNKPT